MAGRALDRPNTESNARSLDLPARSANSARRAPHRRSRGRTGIEARRHRAGAGSAARRALASSPAATSFDTRAVQEGRVFIQDEASQLVAALVGTRFAPARLLCGSREARQPPWPRAIRRRKSSPRSCMRIAPNCCANACTRANVQVIQADALSLPTTGNFDRVLADVPCSGTGTLARNPEIKWRLKPEDLDRLAFTPGRDSARCLGQLAPRRTRCLLHLLAGARGERSRD